MIRKAEVLIPFSKFKFEIAKILKHEDYIESFEKVEDGPFPEIRIVLKYNGKNPAITTIQRVSTPGRRIYAKKDEIPTVLDGFGISILSTSQGLMSNKEAKRNNIGGEVICQIW